VCLVGVSGFNDLIYEEYLAQYSRQYSSHLIIILLKVVLLEYQRPMIDFKVLNSIVPGRHFSLFQGGGTILTDFLGGQNMKKTKCCVQKHKKVTIFQSGGQIPPPPKMMSLVLTLGNRFKSLFLISISIVI